MFFIFQQGARVERERRYCEKKILPSALYIIRDEAILAGIAFAPDLLRILKVWCVLQERGT